MKVILVNGSPNEHGCTDAALQEVAAALRAEGVETSFFWIGKQPIRGCVACGGCSKLGKCVFDDVVNEFVALAHEADGFVFGAPVHFAGIAGSMKCFMDRAFFSAPRSGESPFLLKPGAAIVSARRAGTTAALDQLNKYLLYSQMLVPGSRYWNMVHGSTAADVQQDQEGLQIMRVLGRNLAWLLKLKSAGASAGIPLPEQEAERLATNFIR